MAEQLSAGKTLIFRASLLENYGPVLSTSVFCKLLDPIIHSNVIEHLDHNNIITETQHGFWWKRWCETQLTGSVHDLAETLNEGEQIDSILLDAFEKSLIENYASNYSTIKLGVNY